MVPAEVVAIRDPAILVVEDEVLIRISVSDFLRSEGFTVIEAGNAREALSVLRTHAHVALVLTDINMSGAMEGLGADPENSPVISCDQSDCGFGLSNQ